MKHFFLGCTLFTSMGLAQVQAPATPAHSLDASLHARAGASACERVVHDEPGDGRLWAHGASWKASFGHDGFTFVPRLGGAPHNFPLQFRVSAVRVGGRVLPFAAAVTPLRSNDRVTFDRGALREVYDLALEQVEQTFVVDTALAGDVEVELAVATELLEDTAGADLQFACAFGAVHYGAAFLVRGSEKVAIESAFAGGTLRLRVPAALRGEGPVVIDPVLSVRSSSAVGAVFFPDVAYDATNNRYLLVWESEFSSTDHDLWSEMFDGNGVLIAGSSGAIDISSYMAVRPRVANLDDADRFLVVATFDDPIYGGRKMIHGRTREASGIMAVGPLVLFSDPNLPGDNSNVDVGADSGTGPGNHDWLVVWTNMATINDANILGRVVLGTGQPRAAGVLPIETAGTLFNGNVQVSKGNGNGLVDHPLWCVVYTRYFGSTIAEVHCRTVDPNGVVGSEVPCDTSQNRNLFPQVSSPIRDGAVTRFLITYERQSPLTARAVCVGFQPAWQGTGYFDFTAQFGVIGGSWMRVESDGVRFVVASKGFFAGEIKLQTLAWTGGGLLLHDGPANVQGTEPVELAACRSSGGPVGFYGVGFLQGFAPQQAPALARYGGYSPGPGVGVLPTACSPLVIESAGFPALGATMVFTLSNFGGDLPGFAFGGAATIPIPVCPTCSLGLRFDLPIVPILVTSQVGIAIPTTIGLVGESFAMQGFSLGSGTCLGGFAFSDTITFTIR
jgi:hypothetical protein